MGEGRGGRRRGCLAAIRPRGVVTVEVVVVVPAPARRRAVRGRVGVVVVVAVVTGRDLVDVTGRGRLVVVVAGTVPAPATGGRLYRFTASSTLTG